MQKKLIALALASAGFGVIATFITLFYDAKGWDGAAFALTLFSCAFVGTRLLFPNGINRIGGLNVAMICFSVEIIGLLLVGRLIWEVLQRIGRLRTPSFGLTLKQRAYPLAIAGLTVVALLTNILPAWMSEATWLIVKTSLAGEFC